MRMTRFTEHAVAALVAATLGACERFTSVSAPDLVQPDQLMNATGLNVLRAGAVGTFYVMMGSVIQDGGFMSDELVQTDISGSPQDQRITPVGGTSSQYVTLHQIRINAMRAISAYEALAPTRGAEIAQLFAVKGYTEVFFAEEQCPGVPLSTFDDVPIFGQPLTTAQMFSAAVTDFDSALAHARSDAPMTNLASVGKGRALVGIGKFPEAAAAVVNVPTTFTFQTEHISAGVQSNGIGNNWASRRLSVADREGTNGLDFRSANDPRVALTANGKGIDGVTDVYLYTKYASPTAPIVVSSGVEARLIEAEAALKGGQAQQALNILNALRQTVAGLAPLTLQGTTAAQVDQLFRERAFWLFLTGHRHGDLRRLMREYGRTQDKVFPVGPYVGGRTYGTDVAFPMSISETNNPNYTGCLDRTS
jgi:hypothetical protein